ncbi:MAG: hypothetical protein ACREMJ_02220 [Gemmatimonadales bacterium]
MRTAGLLGLAALACASWDGADAPDVPTGRLRALVVRAPTDTVRDTVRFEAPASAARCHGGRWLVLDAVTGGNGVLLWLRPGDSALAGRYGYAYRADTVPARSATAAVRFMIGDMARGTTLDSGAVEVTEGDTGLAATVRGSGTSNFGAGRIVVDAEFTDVPPPRDSVPCAVEP